MGVHLSSIWLRVTHPGGAPWHPGLNDIQHAAEMRCYVNGRGYFKCHGNEQGFRSWVTGKGLEVGLSPAPEPVDVGSVLRLGVE